ncbi:MAG: BREX-1 system adenine-specific DNA-methyltransferase PglX [Isosphaeraceae bacterium]|jgi:hypothetical protein
MNRNKIKAYAPQARRDFIRAVTDRAALYGLTKEKIQPVVEQGDVALIAGRPYPRSVAALRKRLQERVDHEGFDHVMEAMAYTWFNRLVAIRYMELHGYLDHGFRVLSHPEGRNTPEIVEHAEEVELPGLRRETVIDLKLAGNREAELYRKLLIAQCNALHDAMPFLFERIDDETELLLPDNLLQTDSIVRTLVAGIDEEDWQEVEIIGWLYEAYISERYEAVIGSVVASADIPAATQRFTPEWIVRYLVQNTLGRLWLATYPQSPLKGQMKYYIEPADQTPEVQEQLQAITPTSLNPEEITFLDPACGSAHILVEAYDLFKAIYQERGYRARDIPRLILEKNLFGLEIDDRAAQLAAFALLMKARADDRRTLEQNIQPHVRALVQTDGMDAEDIAAALSVRASKETPPPGLLFETEDNLFTRAAAAAATLPVVSLSDVKALVDLFKHAKTFGSLIQVLPALAARLPQIEATCQEVAEQTSEIASRTAERFLPVIEQAVLMSSTYDCVVTNPPYMGTKYYSAPLKTFVNNGYKNAKADLYACFIERNASFTKQNGFVGMITIPNWMFLSSFEGVRNSLFADQTIDTFIHNGRGVFGSDFGSCSFVLRNHSLPAFRGTFRRLFQKQGSVAGNDELESRFFLTNNYYAASSEFEVIPGSQIAYWVSHALRQSFKNSNVDNFVEIEGQNKTADNERFVRLFWEVDSSRIGTCGKWLFYSKGGGFRKWYGNLIHLVDWSEEARRHYRADPSCRIIAERFWNRVGITWTDITSAHTSFRFLPSTATFDMAGPSVFPRTDSDLLWLMGLLNSVYVARILPILNPTVHVQLADVRAIPVVQGPHVGEANRLVQELLEAHKQDWDAFETSWDFQRLPVLQHKATTLQQSQEDADAECLDRFCRMKELEEGNNRLFITAFGLQDELSPEVPDHQITLYRPNPEEDIKRLISYAIGCTMGRYSLDKPGLIYAHCGNVGFFLDQYRMFPADPDGIIPATEFAWFADDATNRFVEFLGVAWPKEHLEDNLKFVADSLGPNRSESPRETIRRYLATGFYKHHLQTYKRRPIYWLFSSGKQRAFQCLVYLHRYHESTLSRMRTEYVIPLQGMVASRIEHLAGDIASSSSTAQRRKLEKERETLLKQQAELHAYDEKLRHYADKKIALDLDDGVKVNYGKFGDLLAEVKAVTGAKDEE